MGSSETGATQYVMQELTSCGTPLSHTPQSSFQARSPIPGVWGPSPQDLWNMMVSVQSQVAHLTEQITMQQKEIYDQRKEIEGLKEENVKLKQQVYQQQQVQVEDMEDTQHVGQIKETLTPSQTWAQRVSGSSRLGQTHQNKRTGNVSTKNITQDNVEDQEQLERIKKQHNVVISGVEEDDTKETARSLREKLQDIFTTYFNMTDVFIKEAHRTCKKREDKPQIIICTIMDARKRQIILYLSAGDWHIHK